MIRAFEESDMDAVLAIWLDASVKAHDFVAPDFWEARREDMRSVYIPASETFVYEKEGEVVGFYSLHEDRLAAVFVGPTHQRQGIGKALLSHARLQRSQLTLSVYEENEASCQFYLSQGFHVLSRQADEHTGHMEFTLSTGT